MRGPAIGQAGSIEEGVPVRPKESSSLRYGYVRAE